MEKLLLSIKEAAAYSGIGETRIYNLIREDPNFPSVRVGRYHKINSVMLEEWVRRRTEEGRTI